MRTDPWQGLLGLTIYYALQKVYHKLFIENTECLSSNASSALPPLDHPQQSITATRQFLDADFLGIKGACHADFVFCHLRTSV